MIVEVRILMQNYFYGIPGAILSFNVVYACHNHVIKKVNKQVEGNIRNFKGLKKKLVKQGNSYKQGKLPIPVDIQVDIQYLNFSHG